MAFKTNSLRYLGGISGQGEVKLKGKTLAPVQFDLDGYFQPAVGVTGSGEIQAPQATLEALFGRDDLELLTDGGLLLALRFPNAKSPPSSGCMGVEVKGPSSIGPNDWRQ